MSGAFQNANLDAWTFISKGMFAIGWLELGEPDRALLLLEKCFKNIQGPFQVLEQSADNTGGGRPVLWMLTTPPLTGVERIVGRLRGGQLPHWDGGIPAGGAVWLHGVQVSRGSTVKKRNGRTNSSETVDFNFCLSWCQSSEGVPGLLPAPAQRRLRALHPRRELPRPSDGLAAQKGRGLCDPERTARRRCSSSGL